MRPALARPAALRTLSAALALLSLTACAEKSTDPSGTGQPLDVSIGQVEGRILLQGGPFDGRALLRLDHPEGAQQTTRSTAGGLYRFPAVRAGRCLLRIEPPSGYLVALEEEDSLEVEVPPQDVVDIDFDLIPESGAPDDSTGGGPPGLEALRVRAWTESDPVRELLVQATDQATQQPFQAYTDFQGNVTLFLFPGTYAISVPDLAEQMPWLTLVSIEPEFVTLLKDQPEPPLVNVTLTRNPGVPLPPGELWVHVATDSLMTDPPDVPDVPSVVIHIYRAGTDEIVDTGETGDDSLADFELPAGVYDVLMDVPAGFTLGPDAENPIPGVTVEPLAESWVGFMLFHER